MSEALQAQAVDPLLSCLVFLSAHHGRAKSAEAIRAGLAFDEKSMGPSLFCEAAQRLGFKTALVERKDPLAFLPATLPVVLILKDNQACVLTELSKGKAKIWVPETQGHREIPAADLRKSYAGGAILLHPDAGFREGEAAREDLRNRHWFWSLVRDNTATYAQVLVAAVLINLFALVSPLFVMNIYDRVIPNAAIETGWVLGIGALVAFTFDFLLRTLRGYYIDLAGRRIDVIAARRIYDQLLDMKLASRPASSGAFANMLRDFDAVREFITSATLVGMVDLPFALVFLAVVGAISPMIAGALILLMLATILVGGLIQIPLKASVRRSMRASEVKHGLLIETIQTLETVKATGADGRMRARYGQSVGESAASAQSSRFWSALGVNFAGYVQQASAAITILIGMYLVRDAAMSMGGLIACVMLGGRALSPVGQVANLMTRWHQAGGALRTLNGIMSRPVERPVGATFLHRPDLQGRIAFDRVRFAYPGTDRLVLDGVSFTIQAGEKVGIIGRIGSGKSTIARLIAGLYEPQDGALSADGTDYRQIDPADLRRSVGYLAQDVVLFAGTVRDNISAGRPQATESEILAAAKAAGVHDFVSQHPMGYDAQVGEGGGSLSGGQRQAIALARAMLLHPKVLVCDEPTNAMDVQAEESFLRHIREEAKGDRTLILITHRTSLLPLVDRLILLDRGRVVMDAPREDVLSALSSGRVQVQKGALP